VARYQTRRSVPETEQFAGRSSGGGYGLVAGVYKIRIPFQAACFDRRFETLDTLERRRKARLTGDQSDALMAMRNQMRHKRFHRALVLDTDLIEPLRDQAVDEHAGNMIVEDVFERFLI